ncbi:MAG: TIGR04283 family arsenosugar biosynthesis glycosyltransferase [Proteobacteria bacterium]|nr:TIGR04283 family arsenosugar biosynthesis glycosyltransferase [Pseudomonadota bacterium]MBU1688512.1 TIGR04283 family arsenosugar biosynthesis glycosyltransferase [Pseudomonadota bacterium]
MPESDKLPDIQRGSHARPPLLSVIIPTLNEEENLLATLGPLLNTPDQEIIVADGGSTDTTVSLAETAGAKVLESRQGRGAQMNTAARAAAGDILLFLHADTRVPAGYATMIRQTLARPGVSGGAFALDIADPGRALRVIARTATWRSRYLQLPYGDQGLFMTADTFHAVGEYPEIPIMEDFALVGKLRKRGRIITLPTPIITSNRRWQQRGTLTVTVLNQLMVTGYLLGFSPASLAILYRNSSRLKF